MVLRIWRFEARRQYGEVFVAAIKDYCLANSLEIDVQGLYIACDCHGGRKWRDN
jgi:hypothetical protein